MIGLSMNKKNRFLARSTVSLIGEGSLFEGAMHTQADLRIEGEFQGTLESSGEVAVGEKGIVRCKALRARDVIIAGRLEGRVEADGIVRITSTGRLVGTVRAASLVIEQGAVFQGHSEMERAREEDAALPCPVL